jgi:hypothetical protein
MATIGTLAASRNVASLCREWRTVYLRSQYEASLCEDDDDEGRANVAALADANMRDLESLIGDRAACLVTPDDTKAAPGVALAMLRDFPDKGRAVAVLSALHRGIAGGPAKVAA